MSHTTPFLIRKFPKTSPSAHHTPYDVFFRVDNNFTDLCGVKIGRFHLKESVYIGIFQCYRIWIGGLKHLVYRFFQAPLANLLPLEKFLENNYIAKVKKKPIITSYYHKNSYYHKFLFYFCSAYIKQFSISHHVFVTSLVVQVWQQYTLAPANACNIELFSTEHCLYVAPVKRTKRIRSGKWRIPACPKWKSVFLCCLLWGDGVLHLLWK